ncbi:probable histone-lysine N-methyltransferase Mes-4 isoform X2 [Anopheles aquasalis]|uniref:probable histone-lysine N-methyltransferase Mes-4 isoform X2 n=1 Tax=Anopheles aquasalis TaxID=42839 RepID=UPI00215A8260|nr:probable histone-lysine N-methyltransferase Mes-4 isoform X2 [Anopheles aquasalis]
MKKYAKLSRHRKLSSNASSDDPKEVTPMDDAAFSEAMMLSPTSSAKEMVQSQQQTPKRQQFRQPKASSSCSSGTQLLSREQILSVKPISQNTPVSRSPQTRTLMMQLQTSLSPKMTEIQSNGEHRSPSKLKTKVIVEPSATQVDVDGPEVKMQAISSEKVPTMDKEHQSELKVGDRSSSKITVIKGSNEDLLGMDEIKIIGMDASFNSIEESAISTNLLASQSLPEIENNESHSGGLERSSDGDSAKGSSINYDCGGFLVGDMYWGTQSMNHIHWPCMVIPDPVTNQITRKAQKQTSSESWTEVHVVYFAGKGLRAWLKDTQLIPFDSTEQYRLRVINSEFGQVLRAKIKKASQGWRTACRDAESYYAMPAEDRPEHFKEQMKERKQRSKMNMSRQRKQLQRATPESPAYEPIQSTSANSHNHERTVTLGHSFEAESSNLLENNISRFFQSMDRSNTNEMSVTEGFDQFGYETLLKFTRAFLFEENKDKKVDEKIQLYVQQICSLRHKPFGTERTIAQRSIKSLQTAICELRALIPLEISSSNAPSSSSNQKARRSSHKPQSLEEKFLFPLERNLLVKGLPKGYVCEICREPNNTVKCCKCQRYLHVQCVTKDIVNKENTDQLMEEKNWICNDCESYDNAEAENRGKCFICNDNMAIDEPKYRCVVTSCAQLYHLSCFTLFPQYRQMEKQSIVCPYHACHTCVSDDPNAKAANVKQTLVRCIKCPSAYHPEIGCVPAGSHFITNKQIICPKHELVEKAHNVNWCCICCKTGDLLVMCDTCPVSIHRECLNCEPPPPEGKFYCDFCVGGCYPLYNEIVVVKMGQYRWWPALTLAPPLVPDNLLQMPHQSTDICVKFFSSHDMAWINRRQMYKYEQGDSQNLGTIKSGTLNKQYHQAMQEAHTIYVALKEQKKGHQIDGGAIGSPTFTKIYKNRYTASLKESSRRSRMKEENMDSVCNCKKDDDDPCGASSSCINRLTFIECNPETCPAEDRCSNQRFAKRIYPEMEVRKFEDRGHGLVTREDLTAGQFIIEYVGEVINKKEFRRRLDYMQQQNEQHYYFLEVDSEIIIDAGPKGNLARFVNHSCEPNCETQKWTVDGMRVIGIFALKDIKAGEELTFDYCLAKFGEHRQTCLCGSEKCSGQIGEKYRAPKALSIRKRPLSSAKLKTKMSKKAKYENEKSTTIDQGDVFAVDNVQIKEEQKVNDENDEQM